MPNPIVGMVGASAAGAVVQAGAAGRAADAQEAAANAQIAESRRVNEQIRSDLAPYREQGQRAYNALGYELGLSEAPEGYQGISMSPMARFALEQGRGEIEAGASFGGGLYSGRSMKALEDYRRGMALSDRAAQLDRLTGYASSGQNAAAQTAAADTNNLSAVSNALGSIGNAQSAAAIGRGNAIAGGIQQGIGLYQYQQGLNQFGLQGMTQGTNPMAAPGLMAQQPFRPSFNAFASGGALY